MNSGTVSGGLDERALRKAARAMWNEQRKREIKVISSFEFDSSVFIKTGNILRNATSREVAIVGFSLMSECLDAAVRFHLCHSSKRDLATLLDGLGPLSTDAARVRLVKALGWLPVRTEGGIEGYRRARNEVAHKLLTNDEIDILTYLPALTKQSLKEIVSRMAAAAQQHEDEDVSVVLADLPKVFALLLSGYLLEEVVGGPGRLRLFGRVAEESFYSYDEAPPWAREVRRAVVHAVFIAAGRHEEAAPAPSSG